MNWYESVKMFYSRGYYSEEDVQVFVKARLITQEQADEITKHEES